MPLETYKGKSIPSLMARAQKDLGDDVRIVEVNRVRGWDGSVSFELIAADDEGCGNMGKAFVTAANTTELTSSRLSSTGADSEASPKIIAIVGPTGSGKTTTIAKLAGNPLMCGRMRCGVLSLDVFRVGAAAQMKILAKVTSTPFAAVTAGGVEATLRSLAGCEVVFVDTPGRGPRAQRESLKVDEWLSAISPHEVHLAVPAGLNPSLTQRIVHQYRDRGVTHLLPTKLDEMPGDWDLFDMAAELHMPMRWVTDGQGIPTDIRPARPRFQAAMAGRDLKPSFA